MTDLSAYKQGFKNKKIAFCGIGVSNLPLIEMFKGYGADVIACDRKDEQSLGETAEKLKKMGVTLRLGEGYLNDLDCDIVFRTPGMNYNLPELKAMREKGISITSEIEEFFKVCPAYTVAVTGSDGKTTTTTLISEILKADGKNVFLGGNIGTPLLPRIDKITEDDFVVAELSSFQLISMKQSPDTAVVTNVAPNHLDVHKDMQEYIDAKKNVFLYQHKGNRLVINAENDITRDFEKDARCETVFFGHEAYKDSCVFVDDGVITVRHQGKTVPIVAVKDIKIPGDHNVQNYMAAIAAVFDKVNIDSIVRVAKEFGGVEHRIEFVRELRGVRYYNDSIATSPTRAIAGMNSFNQKLIIIAGGYDKHIPFEPFAEKAVTNAKILILMGATAEKIENCIKNTVGFTPETPKILHADSMEEAVKIAESVAVSGDVVTLSPACASFDKYPNFAARGNHFKDIVNSL